MKLNGNEVRKVPASRNGTVACDKCEKIIPADDAKPITDQLMIQTETGGKLLTFGYFRCPHCGEIYICWVDDGITMSYKEKLAKVDDWLNKNYGKANGKNSKRQAQIVAETQKQLDERTKLRKHIISRERNLKNMYSASIVVYLGDNK